MAQGQHSSQLKEGFLIARYSYPRLPSNMTNAVPPSSKEAFIPWMDSQSFPFIIDAITAYADYKTLLAFRATSKAMHARADALLHHHLVLTTEEYPHESWIVLSHYGVMTMSLPGIVVRSFSHDQRLYKIPALMDWNGNEWNDQVHGDSITIGPHTVMGSARAPVTGVDIIGHVPTNGIASLLHAAPNLHTTRYFGIEQGLCAVATGTPNSIINTYLISPNGDAPRHPTFNYMVPTVGGTTRLVVTIGYQKGNNLLPMGNVELYDLPRDITDVVFAFRPAPDDVVEAQKAEYGQFWEVDDEAPVSPPPGKKRKSKATSGLQSPKTARGVLSEVIPKVAMFFKSAYFKKLGYTIRFTFVGTEVMDPKIFGLAAGDDFKTEVLNGVEAAMLDPESELQRNVKPYRPLTYDEMDALRAVGEKHIICMTEKEYQASIKAGQYSLETPEF
ncbi:hypothetical protein Q8F55_004251 [Vanrija albida]|uniref:F-box domain-containing protein n=1 Tax=Vanrija albida TaxID=181172 RepID=A0ABR3Q676_9TREE